MRRISPWHSLLTQTLCQGIRSAVAHSSDTLDSLTRQAPVSLQIAATQLCAHAVATPFFLPIPVKTRATTTGKKPEGKRTTQVSTIGSISEQGNATSEGRRSTNNGVLL